MKLFGKKTRTYQEELEISYILDEQKKLIKEFENLNNQLKMINNKQIRANKENLKELKK